jgi:antitoxin VapB
MVKPSLRLSQLPSGSGSNCSGKQKLKPVRKNPMSLNIKDNETHELVKELAALKGTSMSTAVKVAVRAEIEREAVRQGKADQQSRPRRSEILQAFAREFSQRVKNPIHSWEVDALLYDENGLPK